MLELRHLSKSYASGHPVLAGLSWTFKAGEFVAIMGDSGVGKSTLLNLIAGLDIPDANAGTSPIWVDGVAMSGLDDDAATRLRRQRMGFIFQAFHVLPHLTLLQNVALPKCWPPSAWTGARPISRTSCPVARCSASPSPARWCTVRRWSWPTSRPATSIPTPPTTS